MLALDVTHQSLAALNSDIHINLMTTIKKGTRCSVNWNQMNSHAT